ncbi:MAG: rhomboid family intramembrane serine protease [Bacteroidota bacterium]
MRDFRPSRFQILPVIIKNLLIINVIFFLAQNTVGKKFFDMDDLFALHTFQSSLFRPWQLITHLFMHGDLGHIFSNMLALWMFGSVLENYWGPKRFITFYFVCGIGAALAHMTVLFIENQQMISAFNHLQINSNAAVEAFVSKYPPMYRVETLQDLITSRLNEATIGASGAVFGCLAAFGYLFPNTLIYFYFFIPVKAKWFVLIYAAFELSMAIHNSAGDNVAHVAHLGGALAGIVMVYLWNKRKRDTFF